MWSSLKFKIILLSVVPLLCITGLLASLVFEQSSSLAQQQLELIKQNTLRSKRLELQNHIDQAFASIRDVYEAADANDMAAQQRVKQLLSKLRFADDGYFYAYTLEGINLVHPIMPELQGQNLWNFQDAQGTYLIQDLISQAKQGGGYAEYLWEKPSTGKLERKLGYVVMLDKWQWMFGTGVYLDGIDAELAKVETQTQQNISQTFKWLLFITIVSILVIAFLGASLNISEHKLADKKLKALTQRIIHSQELERRRVSRELHDGINQLLVSIKYRLESATECSNTPDKVTASLNQGLDTIDEAIREIRRISKDLRPSVLDDLGLEAALTSFCQEFEQRTKIDLFLECQLEQKLPSVVETTLYRITQEALQNVEKHARADTVDIDLHTKNKQLYLKIRDNGSGFDSTDLRSKRSPLISHKSRPELDSSGLGLRNIYERIAYIDGEINIESFPEQGTCLSVRVPLDREHAHEELFA